MTYDTEKWTGQHLVAPVASPQCHALSSVLYLLTPAFLFLNLLERQVSHFFSAPRLSQKGRCCWKGKTWEHWCERVRSTHSAQSLPWLDKETEVQRQSSLLLQGPGLQFSNQLRLLPTFFRTRFHAACNLCRWELVWLPSETGSSLRGLRRPTARMAALPQCLPP